MLGSAAALPADAPAAALRSATLADAGCRGWQQTQPPPMPRLGGWGVAGCWRALAGRRAWRSPLSIGVMAGRACTAR